MLLRSRNLSPIIFVYKSLYNLMKKANKESKFQSAIQSEDQQFQQQIQQQQNPLFGEVDGQIIKLGGLDYSLLEQEKSKAAKEKRNILDGLINKINIIEGNVLQRTSDPSKQKQQKKIGTDQYYKDLVKVFNELRHGKHMQSQKKRTQTYLVFELDEFGRRIPTTVQKRIGKVTNKPIYTHFDEKFNKQFGRLLKVKQNHIDANKIIGQARQMYAEDDEDDMFGDDSPNQEKGQSKMNEGPSINIEIGKKLSFGLQQDIFASVKRQKPIPVADTQPQQNDKYFFMRKKVKVNAELEDGYGECYHQSGPSLQELVDLKKQGIEFYGDLKQFKPKQRKAPNINKEYAMVQKIIERNNKK